MQTNSEKRQDLRQALENIRADIGDRIVRISVVPENTIELEVKRENIAEAGLYLRDDPKLQFDFISCVSGVDKLQKMEVVYHVHSLPNSLSLRLKATLDIDNPIVDSLVPVWPGADWHEREAYDLFGITFNGHPDLRRIMLEDDFDGHPMRKSYPQPEGRLR